MAPNFYGYENRAFPEHDTAFESKTQCRSESQRVHGAIAFAPELWEP